LLHAGPKPVYRRGVQQQFAFQAQLLDEQRTQIFGNLAFCHNTAQESGEGL
jgi:hypothetical protein